jgi:hypothetical protein
MSTYEDMPVPPDKSRLESDTPDDPELVGGVPPVPPEGTDTLAGPTPIDLVPEGPDAEVPGVPELDDEG